MMEPTDHNLLAAYAAKKLDVAFGRLVARHAHFVHAVALRRTRDAALAEDVTQAVFIVLARRAGTLSRKTSIVGWLHKTATYAAANAQRSALRRARHERVVARPDTVTAAPATDEVPVQVENALLGLSPRDREIIAMRYLEERTLEEIAGGLPPYSPDFNPIEMAISKMRSLLRKLSRRTLDTLMAGIGEAMTSVTVSDAKAFIQKCGYAATME